MTVTRCKGASSSVGNITQLFYGLFYLFPQLVAETCSGVLSARETVMVPTPAKLATSCSVTRPVPRRLRVFFHFDSMDNYNQLFSLLFISPLLFPVFAHGSKYPVALYMQEPNIAKAWRQKK